MISELRFDIFPARDHIDQSRTRVGVATIAAENGG
jgi:hypothetical protein